MVTAASIAKKIRLETGRKLNMLYAGQYRSVFKGNGILFEGVREYQYGDEVRSIDWNVSARMDHIYIKEYTEERELNIVLALDVSASQKFGTIDSKEELMLEYAAIMLYLAQMNNDRISVMLFTDRVEKFISPKKGRKYVLKVLNDIISHKPRGKETNINAAVDYLEKVLKKRSVVFFISDFLDNDFNVKLKRLKRKHDLVPVRIQDPGEKKIDYFGLVQFYDMETGEEIISDGVRSDRLDQLAGFDVLELVTGDVVENSVLSYFERRRRKRMSRW